MDKDRKAICVIMSEMLDNPDTCGIYPTGKAYDALEKLVEEARAEVIGWTMAECCTTLDRGDDPRRTNIPDVLKRAQFDLQ